MSGLAGDRLPFDGGGQLGAVHRVVDRDDSLQIRPTRVEPPTVQDCRHGQRRRRRVVDLAAGATAVRTMPATATRHPIHHVRGQQHDVVQRQRLSEHLAQLPMFLVTHRTLRAVGIDDHCDRGVRFGCGRNLHKMIDPVEEPVTEVDPHDRPQFAAVQRHQD